MQRLEIQIQNLLAKAINASHHLHCDVMPTPQTKAGIYTKKQPVDLIVSNGVKHIRIEVKICKSKTVYNANSIPDTQKIEIGKLLAKNIPIYLLVYIPDKKSFFIVNFLELKHKQILEFSEQSLCEFLSIVKVIDYIFDKL